MVMHSPSGQHHQKLRKFVKNLRTVNGKSFVLVNFVHANHMGYRAPKYADVKDIVKTDQCYVLYIHIFILSYSYSV